MLDHNSSCHKTFFKMILFQEIADQNLKKKFIKSKYILMNTKYILVEIYTPETIDGKVENFFTLRSAVFLRQLSFCVRQNY